MPDSASARALAAFDRQFVKSFGEEALGSHPFEVIPTGSLTLDFATGVGGYVQGRLTEIWGPDDAGKTSLAILGAIEAQKKYPTKPVAWINMERKFDEAWAAGYGLDLSKHRFRLMWPPNAEAVADMMKSVLSSGLFSMVVLDSIGAMIPEKDKQKEAGETVVATLPKVVTRMVNIANVEAEFTETAVVLINQVRANVDKYGPRTMTAGGFALKHATTMKFKIKRTGEKPFEIKEGSDKIPVGQEVAIEVERNKVAPKGRVATVALFSIPTEQWGPQGFDRADEAATLGIRMGLIARQANKDGGESHNYVIPGTGETVYGRPKVVEALRTNPELVEEIRSKALETRAGEVHAVEVEDEEHNELAETIAADTAPKPALRRAADIENDS